MAKTVADVMTMVKDNEVKFVDFRFTDTRGKSSMSPYRCPISRKKNSPPAMLLTALLLLAGKALRPQTCNSCPTPTPPI